MQAPALLIAIDLSTKPGWAIFRNGVLTDSGTRFADKTVKDFGLYPFNYIDLARHIIRGLWDEIILPAVGRSIPDEDFHLVLEESTASSQNYSQKKLEFLHFCMIEEARRRPCGVVYIRDGVWKSIMGARQNADEKRLNSKIARQKKKKKEQYLKQNPGALKAPNFRAKLDLDGSGKARVVGRLTIQDYYIRVVREKFGLALGREQEDQAAAILLGAAYLMDAPPCDGTDTGGIKVQS